ncbi:MAG: hypothetical protein CHACPFDD_02426 [Phycisphaerae bacterium]|nr:hypothetical protein [Phycisphaerae bacterium]
MNTKHTRYSKLAGACLLAIMSSTALAQTVGPQVRIDVNGGTDAANETSMASVEGAPLEAVGVWNDWRDSTASEIIRMGVAATIDGGATWTDFLVRPPLANQSSVEGDPMTAYDTRTGTLWVGAISFAGNGGVFVARKNPGLTTFQPSVMARATSSADKCWMAAGIRPGLPNSTRLYIAFNQGVIWSDDMGATWTAPKSLGTGIGFLPRVGPAGELYVAYWDFGTGVLLKRSLDGGTTITSHTIATRMVTWGTQDGSKFPGRFRVPPMNYLAVDPVSGTLYCVYFDQTSVDANGANIDLYFTKSTNQGTTWTTPVVINGDSNPRGDQFWPWLEVDQCGALHMVFLDTRGIVQADNTINGMFNAYYSYSDDGGATWAETKLTPAAFNSNNDGLNRSDQFMGDYLGLGLGADRVYPCYLSSQNGDTDIFTNVVITPDPEAPTSVTVNREGFCRDDAGTITLTAVGGSGSRMRWFDDACGGHQIGTGNPLVIASPTDTTTYYARWETCAGDSACASASVFVQIPCDANCDGSVNGFDVDPFVEQLTGGGGSPCADCIGDMNGDGSVNGFDVDDFVAALLAGGC